MIRAVGQDLVRDVVVVPPLGRGSPIVGASYAGLEDGQQTPEREVLTAGTNEHSPARARYGSVAWVVG